MMSTSKLSVVVMVALLVAKPAAGRSFATPVGMTDALRLAVLNKHNEYRSLTALGHTSGMPKASGMIELAWDPALERMAENHVSGCVATGARDLARKYSESADRAMKDYQTTTKIKQLQFYTTDPAMFGLWSESVMAALEEFYGGYKNYSWGPNKCDRRSRCGDYKQMVWSTTRYVGCSYNACDSLRRPGKERVSDSVYVTCFYVRSAWGGRPYRPRTVEEAPCQNCPSDLAGCTNGLCSRNIGSTINAPPTPNPKLSCSVSAYDVLTSESIRLASIANIARNDADTCILVIGVEPTLEICSGLTSPTGCFTCLREVDEAKKALDKAAAMENRKMKMERACLTPVSLPLDIPAKSCIERVSIESDAAPLRAYADGNYRGCKNMCRRDAECGCFKFGDGICTLYGSNSDCVLVPTWAGSHGGFCAN